MNNDDERVDDEVEQEEEEEENGPDLGMLVISALLGLPISC